MSESAGGHGGGWLVTYCDMVTLLMACFIMVITFGNKEPDKYSPLHGSLVGGKGGSGPAGVEKKAFDRAAVVWRFRSQMGRIGEEGSEMPSLYADPSPEASADLLQHLSGAPLGTLADSYSVRVPTGLLVDSNGQLMSGGVQLLHVIAQNLRRLPYDIRFLVDDARNISQAITLCQHMAQQEAIHPGHLGVGVRTEGDRGSPS